MKIQSLSVVVPAKRCINNCKFCVSKMHESGYENMMSDKNLYYDLYKKDYINRLQFARDNGCNTVMLTGDCEPLQNQSFLTKFADYNSTLEKPFRIIEIQTVGNLLKNDYLYFLRHHVGVTTISLSVNHIWDDQANTDVIGCNLFDLSDLTQRIKTYRFNLRLSINLTDLLFSKGHRVTDIFNRAKELGADQVTLRKMYAEAPFEVTARGTLPEETRWMMDHMPDPSIWEEINMTVTNILGIKLDELEYGRTKYKVLDMGVVIDDDCMATRTTDVAKYLILRPDAKLYSRWDTKASLIF